MGRQIIQQPDGLYAVFSSVVDCIIGYDYSAAELEDDFANEAAEQSRRHTRDVLKQLAAGEKPYRQFTMSWQEAVEQHVEHADPSDKRHTDAILGRGAAKKHRWRVGCQCAGSRPEAHRPNSD